VKRLFAGPFCGSCPSLAAEAIEPAPKPKLAAIPENTYTLRNPGFRLPGKRGETSAREKAGETPAPQDNESVNLL
jgi:hypothetical protein